MSITSSSSLRPFGQPCVSPPRTPSLSHPLLAPLLLPWPAGSAWAPPVADPEVAEAAANGATTKDAMDYIKFVVC